MAEIYCRTNRNTIIFPNCNMTNFKILSEVKNRIFFEKYIELLCCHDWQLLFIEKFTTK